MKAAGYIRESTDQQATDGYGMSAQQHSIRSYCELHGWELTEIYADAGRSGRTMRGREDLARLLADARSGRFERVVFWKLDRLGRNLKDLLEICDQLEAADIGIVSIQEAIDTGTAAGRMIRSFLGAVAEFEREVTVERIKAGLEEKARQGKILGPLPLGYVRDEKGEISEDPLIGPLIRSAFQAYAGGQHSLRGMAVWAASVGLRSAAGNPLDRLSVRKLLTNITYSGQVVFHGEAIGDGKHPAIVDPGLFAQVQEQLSRRRQLRGSTRPFGKEPYPLSGVGACARCGSTLLGLKASKVRRRYMRCSKAHRQGKTACAQPMMRAEVLEAQIAAYVGDMRLPPEFLEAVVAEIRRRRSRIAPIEDVGRLEREIERWRRLFVMDEIDEARYRHETAPLRRRMAAIESPQEVLDVEKAISYLCDVGKLWAASPRGLQREFVQEVFQCVTVDGPQVATITPRDVYEPMFVLDRQRRFGGEFSLINGGGVDWLPGQDSNL